MTRSKRWMLVVLALALGVPAEGGVVVHPDAAATGAYGMRAEVRSGCEGEVSVLVLGPVVGPQAVTACKEIVSASEVRSGGQLELWAGRSVTLYPGFSVASGGRLVVGTGSEWAPSYVLDETGRGQSALEVSWRVRLDETRLGSGGELVMAQLATSSGRALRVRFEQSAIGGWLWLEADGARSERLSIGPGWRAIRVRWSGEGSGGHASLEIDGGSPSMLLLAGGAPESLVDLALGVIEASGTGGWVDFDDYEIREL